MWAIVLISQMVTLGSERAGRSVSQRGLWLVSRLGLPPSAQSVGSLPSSPAYCLATVHGARVCVLDAEPGHEGPMSEIQVSGEQMPRRHFINVLQTTERALES